VPRSHLGGDHTIGFLFGSHVRMGIRIQREIRTDVVNDISSLRLETVEEIIGDLGGESLVESG